MRSLFSLALLWGSIRSKQAQVHSTPSSLASRGWVRLRSRARSRCPPRHWAAICGSRGARRLRCGLQPRPHRCSLGMVAGGARGVWRHHRRWHRLGARVDPDRARSERGVALSPSSAADGGDDQGLVTLWACRLSVGISADIRPSSMTATSRSSRSSIEAVELFGRLQPRGRWQARWLLSARRRWGALLHARSPFPSLGMRGLLCGPIDSGHVSFRNAVQRPRAPGLSLARSGRRPAAPRSPEPQWRR
jgi:hypothetical protein